MVPIHDTDVAAERFEREKWRTFELWEKIEVRERKKRRLWILSTVLAFLLISSVPPWMDRNEKWHTLKAARALAAEISELKRLTALKRMAYQIRFLNPEGLEFVVEEKVRCSDTPAKEIRRGSLAAGWPIRLVLASEASGLGLERVVDSFCYDPLQGAIVAPKGSLAGSAPVGFALIPVKDLTEGRADRISTLLLQGESAEITFN